MSDVAESRDTRHFPSSWYPVCTSRQVRQDKPTPIIALGQEWLAFRTRDGRCRVVHRYCCHMGTDLARGRIVDSTIRCPLHHWQFDGEGRCVRIPGKDSIPEQAALVTLRCAEHFGIVFVAHGPESLFDFSSFAGTGEPAHSRTRVVAMPAPCITVSLNLFDMQHLVSVHHRVLSGTPDLFSLAPPHLGIRYSARNTRQKLGNRLARWLGLTARDIRIDCWGGNLLLVSIAGRRPDFIMALAPVDNRNCRLFVATTEHTQKSNPVSALLQITRLEIAAVLTRFFIEEDIKTLSNARTMAGVLLPDLDAAAIRFWKYSDALERFDAASPT